MVQKKVLVTGASKGIGKAICQRLLQDGYSVVGVARTKPSDFPSEIEFHCVDLSDNQAVKSFLQTPDMNAPFYGLVNNVGMVPKGMLSDVTHEDIYKAVQLNIEVAILFSQAMAKGMSAAGRGRIVNISSRAAIGKESRTIYSMTKAGLIGMTRTWALEFAASGITVNAIAPGPIETEFFSSVNDPNDPRTQSLLDSIPVKRMGRPEDVAHAVAYFADERTGFVTGQTHYVCGGITIGAA
ncbi:MAG: SDR family oxidoreductase [Polaromonas sp.]|nr:SDR family oxidoreductase [Polaromonas sp.]